MRGIYNRQHFLSRRVKKKVPYSAAYGIVKFLLDNLGCGGIIIFIVGLLIICNYVRAIYVAIDDIGEIRRISPICRCLK